uniref:Uncharacterized protein n=1 Tax=Arundo donax TaxID=35708 RepID=A0A0A8ZK37_ARUDO
MLPWHAAEPVVTAP